jgi:hypothetical protein
MRGSRFLISCASLLVASSALAAPATRPTPEDEKLRMQRESTLLASRIPTVDARTPRDVVKFAVTADMLSTTLLLKDTPRTARIALPIPGVITLLQTFPLDTRGTGKSHGFQMQMRDFSPAGSMWVQTTISFTDGRVQVVREFESATVSGSVQLIQDAPPSPGDPPPSTDPVRLFITRDNDVTDQSEVNMKLAGPTFVELCRDHPLEMQQYLRPIFHDLGQEATVFAPNPAAVWQSLAEDWKPDDALSQRVRAAIAKFDAEDFQERQSASHDLREIGEPAALTLMQMDRSKMSPGQSSGIDTFLAPYLPLSPQDAKRLGKDVTFLLDGQYCSDLPLRKIAAARLAKLTGKPIGFDPAADDDTRLAQVARLREPPTTQLSPTTNKD